jgi:hypothetical protein
MRIGMGGQPQVERASMIESPTHTDHHRDPTLEYRDGGTLRICMMLQSLATPFTRVDSARTFDSRLTRVRARFFWPISRSISGPSRYNEHFGRAIPFGLDSGLDGG